MDGPQFAYQADVEKYVRQAGANFKPLKGVIDRLGGGFAGKIVLEYGVGFQLPLGGLRLALASKDGAKQCFGIDIPLPSDYDDEPFRLECWRAARDLLDIECSGIEQHNRVTFHLYDTLWFDDFVQPLTLLQMSVSNMFFKDAMFDIAFSTATMEHVRRPEAVFSELFRVLKPGGLSYMRWNHFASLTMGGHDVGVPFHYPWAHLRLDEARHIEVLREVYNDPELWKKAFPLAHTPTARRAAECAADPAKLRVEMLSDLNKYRISHMVHIAQEAGFDVIESDFEIDPTHSAYLTPEIRAELADYSEEELLAHTHHLSVRKPAI